MNFCSERTRNVVLDLCVFSVCRTLGSKISQQMGWVVGAGCWELESRNRNLVTEDPITPAPLCSETGPKASSWSQHMVEPFHRFPDTKSSEVVGQPLLPGGPWRGVSSPGLCRLALPSGRQRSGVELLATTSHANSLSSLASAKYTGGKGF